MTTMSLTAVGLYAQYTQHGDWAFDFAFDLAKKHDVRLNIYRFPEQPSGEVQGAHRDGAERGARRDAWDDEWVAMDRELREHYDERLGDYVEVGFRVCRGSESIELRRCLMHHEYSVLVVGYPSGDASAATLDMVTFAGRLCAPVVLVGPDRPDQYQLNTPAVVIGGQLDLAPGSYKTISLPFAGEPCKGIPTAITEDEAWERIRRGAVAFRVDVPDSEALQELVRHSVADPTQGVLIEDSRPIVLATLAHLVGPYVVEALYTGYNVRLHRDGEQWTLEFRNPSAP